MFYELLTITPFAAVASCIALGVVTIIVCSNEVVPEASGFGVHDRRKAGRSARAWQPRTRPRGGGATKEAIARHAA
jgi:hypothetical protein